MSNEIFEFLHNKLYTLDGISGVFKYTTYKAIYPYEHMVHKLHHEADKEGMQTKKYRETKQKLGDDWSTDLTDSIEKYCDIALELGYESQ